jgi:hypothetical protein
MTVHYHDFSNVQQARGYDVASIQYKAVETNNLSLGVPASTPPVLLPGLKHLVFLLRHPSRVRQYEAEKPSHVPLFQLLLQCGA